ILVPIRFKYSGLAALAGVRWLHAGQSKGDLNPTRAKHGHHLTKPNRAALVLALPPTPPHREILTAIAFGVVLFTLVVQGLTLPLVIRRLGLGHP
ncbi:MAG: hypothetical protein M3R06_06595, partial [Chloroflexota bacterium]|nr:hypothetical protein [Chloroflexota bacterium]